MSDTTINFCGNTMFKSVKIHFSGNTKNLGFEKVNLKIFSQGSEFILVFKLVL